MPSESVSINSNTVDGFFTCLALSAVKTIAPLRTLGSSLNKVMQSFSLNALRSPSLLARLAGC